MAGGSRGASVVTFTRGGPSGDIGGALVIGGNVNSCGRLAELVKTVVGVAQRAGTRT